MLEQDELHALAEKQAAMLADEQFHLRRPDVGVDILVQTTAEPKIVSEDAYLRFLETTVRPLGTAVDKVTLALLQNEQLAMSVGLSRETLAFVREFSPDITQSWWMARLDLFLHHDRQGATDLQAWSPEWNSDIPGGMAWGELIQRSLSEFYPEVQDTHFIGTLGEALRVTELAKFGTNYENIVMLVNPYDRSEMDLMARLLQETGHYRHVVVVDDPRQIQYHEGNLYVSVNGEQVVVSPLIFRREKASSIHSRVGLYRESGLYKAIQEGQATMVNPITSTIADSRAVYALLYEVASGHRVNEFGLTSEELAAVRQVIPPTYSLNERTLVKLLRNPDGYVIKTEGASGAAVYLPTEIGAEGIVRQARRLIAEGAVAIMQQVQEQHPYPVLVYDKQTGHLHRQIGVSGFDPYIFNFGNGNVRPSRTAISRFQPVEPGTQLPVKVNVGNPKNPAHFGIVGFN